MPSGVCRQTDSVSPQPFPCNFCYNHALTPFPEDNRMSDGNNKENKSKADDVHISDGLGELIQVSEQLTEEELERAAEEAKQAVEDAKKQNHH